MTVRLRNMNCINNAGSKHHLNKRGFYHLEGMGEDLMVDRVPVFKSVVVG